MITYLLPDDKDLLIFDDLVVGHFSRNRQLHQRVPEVGGQLFAEFSGEAVMIKRATGPRPQDSKGRYFFSPDRRLERQEIALNFDNGLHYVGDWHTHPQDRPTPSPLDISSMKDCFLKSRHALSGFILVVVGRLPAPEGLSVTLHAGHGYKTLRPKEE
jgi:integrative and conjugative element protein (TIGR02256 family)